MERLDRAIYDTAHDFSGGVPAMAKRLATKAGTLNNKVDAHMDGHRLNIYEARAMMLASHDYRILFSLAYDCGFCCVEIGDWADCSDMELLDKITEMGARRGDVDREIHDALKNGRISPRERDRILDAIQASIRANMEMFSRIDALTEAGASHA